MNVSAHFGRTIGGTLIDNSTAFCMAALSQANVALVMGSAFGAEGFARHVVCHSLQTLEKGFDAIEQFLQAEPLDVADLVHVMGDLGIRYVRPFTGKHLWDKLRIPSRFIPVNSVPKSSARCAGSTAEGVVR